MVHKDEDEGVLYEDEDWDVVYKEEYKEKEDENQVRNIKRENLYVLVMLRYVSSHQFPTHCDSKTLFMPHSIKCTWLYL